MNGNGDSFQTRGQTIFRYYGNVLTLDQSSQTSDGYLSREDWNRFNASVQQVAILSQTVATIQRPSLWYIGIGPPGDNLPNVQSGDKYLDAATGDTWTFGPATRETLWFEGIGPPGDIPDAQALDRYLDTSTGNVYTFYPPDWVGVVPPPPRGSLWFGGNGPPGDIPQAITGDNYLDYLTGDVYTFV